MIRGPGLLVGSVGKEPSVAELAVAWRQGRSNPWERVGALRTVSWTGDLSPVPPGIYRFGLLQQKGVRSWPDD